MYKFVKEVFKPYMSEEKLLECWHPYSSQKNEAFMRTIHRYAPKTRNFGGSTSLLTRVYLAAITDSVGTTEASERIFTRLGIESNSQSTKLFGKINQTKESQGKRAKTSKAKKARAENWHTRKRELLEEDKKAKKNGTTYGKDAMELKEDGTGTKTGTSKKKRITNKTCTACSMTGHAKHNTKKCPENPKYRGPAMKKIRQGVYTQTEGNNNNNGTGGVCSKCEQKGHKRNNTRKCPEHQNYTGPPMQKVGRGTYIRLDSCTVITPKAKDNEEPTKEEAKLPESTPPQESKQQTTNSEVKEVALTNHRDETATTTPSHLTTIGDPLSEFKNKEDVRSRNTRDILKFNRWGNQSVAKLPPVTIPTKIKKKKKKMTKSKQKAINTDNINNDNTETKKIQPPPTMHSTTKRPTPSTHTVVTRQPITIPMFNDNRSVEQLTS